MKILWLTNIPSPYRVDFFNELGKNCSLTVIFESQNSSERDESWSNFKIINFNGIFLKGIKSGVDSAFSFSHLKYFKEHYDQIIISNPLTLTGILTIQYLKLKRIPYSIVSDGGMVKKEKGIKELVKKIIFTGAEFYFSTALIHDKYYLKYGAKKEKIIRYPFTSLKKAEILTKRLSESEKKSYKNKLNIFEEKIIVSVGRFTYGKGYDVLLKASKHLASNNIGIYIIGGIPPQEYKDLVNKFGVNNIHFIPFKSKEILANYYKAADIFVLPTRGDVWGLVINEAMAYGAPVVTTKNCVAGIELIEDGINGYLYECENYTELNDILSNLIDDEEKLAYMSENNIAKISSYTIEAMANVHLNILMGKK